MSMLSCSDSSSTRRTSIFVTTMWRVFAHLDATYKVRVRMAALANLSADTTFMHDLAHVWRGTIAWGDEMRTDRNEIMRRRRGRGYRESELLTEVSPMSESISQLWRL